MNNIFLYLGSLIFLISIPVEYLFPWLYLKIRQIDAQLLKPRSKFYMSKAPFLFLLILGANFLKGYGVIYFTDQFIESEYYFIAFCLGVIIIHNWSPWIKFTNRKNFWFMLLGIYTFIDPGLAIAFTLGYIVFSVLFNSFLIGGVLNLFFMFFMLWFTGAAPLYLLLNVLITLIVILAYSIDLLDHFEHSPYTLKKSFLNR